jgi:hypothetical protein
MYVLLKKKNMFFANPDLNTKFDRNNRFYTTCS